MSRQVHSVTWASCRHLVTFVLVLAIALGLSPSGSAFAATKAKPTAPKPTVITKVEPKLTAITVKWKKSALAKGYEVRAVPVAKGKSKTIRVSGANKVAATVTGLSEACAYKVQVRPFATTGGKRLYAKWSAAKSAKTTERVYTITYDLAGGTQAAGQKTSYKASGKTFELLEPSRTGFEFTGWFVPGGSNAVTSVVHGTKGDLKFVAQWNEVHSYVTTEEIPPTCTEDGLHVESCIWCDKTIETTLPATGHTYKVAATVRATCIKDGKRTYECPLCGDSYEEVIPMTGVHSLVEHEQVEPTCMEQGSLGYWECTGCGKLFSDAQGDAETTDDEISIPATGVHHLSLVPSKTPTCYRAGVVEHYKCDDCGRVFLDAEGAEPTSLSEIGVAVTSHNYVEYQRVNATCMAGGSVSEKCSYCGTTRKRTLTALGHSYIESVITRPTCTGDGSTKYRCTRCSDTYTKTTKALGHSYVTKTKTIQAAGYTCVEGHKFTQPSQIMRLVSTSSGSSYRYVSCCPTCKSTSISYHEAVTSTYRECTRCGQKTN